MITRIMSFFFGLGLDNEEGFYVEQKYRPNSFRSIFQGE